MKLLTYDLNLDDIIGVVLIFEVVFIFEVIFILRSSSQSTQRVDQICFSHHQNPT